MRDHRPKLLLCAALLLWTMAPTALALDAKMNMHEITGQRPSEACQDCHSTAPGVYLKSSSTGVNPDWNLLKKDGITLCLDCHADAKEEHEVGGAVIDFRVPADLPLTSENTLMCMTCHFMHGSLKSDRPWASVSFMDRATGNERMHKSYLLRRNNSAGEFCLVCHNTNEEKNR